MGPKPNTRTRSGRGKSRRGGGVSIGAGMAGVLVEDLLQANDYDRYLNEFHNSRLTSSQFFCDIDTIERLGYGFKYLLAFQNLRTFLGLRNLYDPSQVKAFYCIFERQPDNVSFTCPFNKCVVTLTPSKWAGLVGLGCDGVDIESADVFPGYNKESLVQSISKTCVAPVEHSNFSAMQLKCDDKILHWIIAKIIICKQDNFGRIDNFDLQVMWLIKNRIKVNWPLFLCNRMIT